MGKNTPPRLSLYDILRALGEIMGTAKTYTADELTIKTEDVRLGDRDISFITRDHSIRSTVEQPPLSKQTK